MKLGDLPCGRPADTKDEDCGWCKLKCREVSARVAYAAWFWDKVESKDVFETLGNRKLRLEHF